MPPAPSRDVSESASDDDDDEWKTRRNALPPHCKEFIAYNMAMNGTTTLARLVLAMEAALAGQNDLRYYRGWWRGAAERDGLKKKVDELLLNGMSPAEVRETALRLYKGSYHTVAEIEEIDRAERGATN